jgi:transposase-like protein
LRYEKGNPAGRGSGNNRNGFSAKTVLRDDGEIEISVPRDRAGIFEPQLIQKGQTRFDGFADKILEPLRPWHDGPRDPREFAIQFGDRFSGAGR